MNYPLGDNPMASRGRMDIACKRLWCAVLQQAIKDSHWDVTARSWFFSTDQEAGSFLWICTVLDFNPTLILTLLATRYLDEGAFAWWSKTDIPNLTLWREFATTVPIGTEEWQRMQQPGGMN